MTKIYEIKDHYDFFFKQIYEYKKKHIQKNMKFNLKFFFM